MSNNPEDKIIKFPFSGDEKPEVNTSNIHLGDAVFGALPLNVEILPGRHTDVADFDGLWRSSFKQMLQDSNLPEIPENILGIKNGTIIQMERGVPDKGVHAKEELVLFFDGTRIHAGGIHAPLSWSLEELIDLVNKKEVSVLGEIE